MPEKSHPAPGSLTHYLHFLDEIRKDAPEDSPFRVGDKVTFTNDFGVSFPGYTVIGFTNEGEGLYGRNVFLDKAAYWYPASYGNLTLE